MDIIKNFLIVGMGSFLGGGMRYLVSRLVSLLASSAFPAGTFAVNIVGCLILGFLSGLPAATTISPQTRLFLTTGFCGGFTTFSTFMNESASLWGESHYLITILYLVGSFALGLLCVWAGHTVAKLLA